MFAQIPNPINFANQAETHGVVWFLAILVFCLVVAVVFFARWHLGQHQNLVNDHRADRDTYHKNLNDLNARQNATQEKLAGVLAETNLVMRENQTVLRECADELRICRKERES